MDDWHPTEARTYKLAYTFLLFTKNGGNYIIPIKHAVLLSGVCGVLISLSNGFCGR